MKILTINPVVVNGKDIDPIDMYLSANGDMDDFFGIDGRNQNEVKAFQTYANTRGANLVVDGLYYRKDGKKSQTALAYDMFGTDWEKIKLGNVNATSNVPVVGTPIAQDVIVDAKLEEKSLMTKFKELSTTKKALVIGIPVILIIILIASRKNGE